MRASIGVWAMTMALAVGFVAASCASDTTKPAARGRRGESCQSRNDCQGGLACLGGVCGTENFDISPEAGACEAIFCEIDNDCCELPGNNCEVDTFECVDNECIRQEPPCMEDPDCTFGLFCVEGACVECRTNDDCFGGDDVSCVAGTCFRPECMSDADCAADGLVFDVCEGGECVFAGCETDRQCQAALNNPLVECVDPGDGSPSGCIQPCETDGECNFFGRFEGCVNGTCQYLGCETDGECAAQCVRQPQTCPNFDFGDPAPIRFVCQ